MGYLVQYGSAPIIELDFISDKITKNIKLSHQIETFVFLGIPKSKLQYLVCVFFPWSVYLSTYIGSSGFNRFWYIYPVPLTNWTKRLVFHLD